jgi:hypothetical protein
MAALEKTEINPRTAQAMTAIVRAARDTLELSVIAKRLQLLERRLGL